jgi:preprotein translocase subunit SecD
MAVDANVLIFERAREEMRDGAHIRQALIEGSRRAWPSIRDGNLSSLISAIVLYWLSGSSVVQGFALVFGLGVIVSMLSAIGVSRTFAIAIAPSRENAFTHWLFSNGFKK